VGLAVIWGCSPLFIKLSLRIVPAVGVAFVRLALGSLTLAAFCAVSRTRLPAFWRTWWHLAVVALLLNSAPFTLMAYGETRISSGLAGIVNGLTPLLTLAVVGVAFPDQPTGWRRVAGLVVGFLGILIVIGVWEGIPGGQLVGVAACLGAVCCYSVGYPYARAHLIGTGDGALALATAQVILGMLLLVPFELISVFTGHGLVARSIPAGPLLALLGLGALGTGVAYVLNFRIIDAAGSTIASTITYCIPVFAVVLGATVLGESVSWHEPVGGVVVLIGIAMAQTGLGATPARYRPSARATGGRL
jgi:drug/metabolite transporter (DMT)-like permease